MSNPVYSAQFIVRPSGEPLTPFIVPDGFTAVIRDFSALERAAAAIYELDIQNSLEAEMVGVAQLKTIGVADFQQWLGRVVVPQGGQISVQGFIIGTAADIYVGGYLLTNSGTR